MEATQASVDGWINKTRYIHTREYYSALKREDISSHAITQTNLEDIMLSEINQTQKDKHCMIPPK